MEGGREGRLLLPRGCSWRAAAQRKHTGLGEAGREAPGSRAGAGEGPEGEGGLVVEWALCPV